MAKKIILKERRKEKRIKVGKREQGRIPASYRVASATKNPKKI